MENFTLRTKILSVALFVSLFMWQAVSAADILTVKELFGRYTFSGKLSYEDRMTGEPGEVPVPAGTGYDMAVLPTENENEVYLLGFFGFGGGIRAVYDSEKSTLTCLQEAAIICNNVNAMTGGGAMVTVDAGKGNQLNYVYTVSKNGDTILLTAASPMKAGYMDFGEGIMGTLTYEAGYTLTKKTGKVPASGVGGMYDFEGNEPANTMLAEASEFFSLTVNAETAGKMTMSGLFGFADKMEVDYYENGGLIVLPSSFEFSNGCFIGSSEGDPDDPYDDVIIFEPAVYFFVESGKLVSPCSFIVNGAYDSTLEMRASFSFVGGEAKIHGDGIGSQQTDGRGICVLADGNGIRVTAEDNVEMQVYDMQGMTMGSACGRSAVFPGLKSGLYLVRAGAHVMKVAVE